jgi:hypothetical protein
MILIMPKTCIRWVFCFCPTLLSADIVYLYIFELMLKLLSWAILYCIFVVFSTSLCKHLSADIVYLYIFELML